MSCVYGICAFVLRCFFSVLRLYSKWSIVWGLKHFSSSLSSCKSCIFLNTLSPVLSTPLSYVCCVCMDRLMANFAGTCTSDNKGLLLPLQIDFVFRRSLLCCSMKYWMKYSYFKKKTFFYVTILLNSTYSVATPNFQHPQLQYSVSHYLSEIIITR